MSVTAAQYARRVKGYGEVFDVEVGANRRRFTLYKTLATRESEFLRAATSPAWNNGQPVDLSDEEPHNFVVFMHWLESDQVQICNMTCYRWGIFPDMNNFTPEDVEVLIAAYGLGLKLLAFRFCDSIMTALETVLEKNGGRLTTDHIDQAYIHGSPLRQLVVDCFVKRPNAERREHLDATYHPEFLAELAQALWSPRIASDEVPGQTGCKHHLHLVEELCHASKAASSSRLMNRMGPTKSRTLRFVMGGQKTVIYTFDRRCSAARTCLAGDCCCFLHHFRSESRTKDGTDVIEIRLPGLCPTALELFMHWSLLGWTSQDVVLHLMINAGKEDTVQEDVLITLVDLYHLGMRAENEAVCNHAVNAIVEWAKLTKKMPPERVINHAFDTLGPVYNPVTFEGHNTPLNRCLLLLAGMHAWNDTSTASTNIQFLGALTIFHRAIQIKLRETLRSERNALQPFEAPYSGVYLCRYFHEHMNCRSEELTEECLLNFDAISERERSSSRANLPQGTGEAQQPTILELCEERFKAAAIKPGSS